MYGMDGLISAAQTDVRCNLMKSESHDVPPFQSPAVVLQAFDHRILGITFSAQRSPPLSLLQVSQHNYTLTLLSTK